MLMKLKEKYIYKLPKKKLTTTYPFITGFITSYNQQYLDESISTPKDSQRKYLRVHYITRRVAAVI